jgi:NADPH-dependent 2,4-dienoyl-CoA reductase/sulfur reductase-like enzyme
VSTPDEVLVVGASAAGLATVEALRRKGYQGRLTLLGAEPHPSYDRPPGCGPGYSPGRTV